MPTAGRLTAGGGFSIGNGEKVLPAAQWDVTLEQNLLTIRLDGQILYLDLTGKEAAP